MFECQCGCRMFAAHQIVRMDIVVTGDNTWERNLHESAEASIYDAETPYGPYTCMNCGKEYASLGK